MWDGSYLPDSEKMKKYAKTLIPIVLLAMLLPILPRIDLELASYFYKGSGQFYSAPWVHFLYRYGPMPSILFAVMALATYILSFYIERFRSWRAPSLYFVLVMALGAGALCHGLKELWGRPRPVHIEMFGGAWSYFPIYHIHWAYEGVERLRSFPSGHAATAFYPIAFYVFGVRFRSPTCQVISLLLTLIWGGAVSLSRISQGKHFFSDVMMALLLMWVASLIIDHWVFKDRSASKCG